MTFLLHVGVAAAILPADEPGVLPVGVTAPFRRVSRGRRRMGSPCVLRQKQI